MHVFVVDAFEIKEVQLRCHVAQLNAFVQIENNAQLNMCQEDRLEQKKLGIPFFYYDFTESDCIDLCNSELIVALNRGDENNFYTIIDCIPKSAFEMEPLVIQTFFDIEQEYRTLNTLLAEIESSYAKCVFLQKRGYSNAFARALTKMDNPFLQSFIQSFIKEAKEYSEVTQEVDNELWHYSIVDNINYGIDDDVWGDDDFLEKGDAPQDHNYPI